MDNYPSDNRSTPTIPPVLDGFDSTTPSGHQGHIHPVDQFDGAPSAPPTPAPAVWSPEALTPPEPPTPPEPSMPPPAPVFTSSLPDPTPPSVPMASSDDSGVVPQAVVRVRSPRGVEYVFLTIALFTGAIGLTSALISLVNGKTDFSVLEFPAALLLVSIPVFAWLFLRLKKAELINPKLRLDPSKRRSTQFMQIFSFIICFFTLIGFVSLIFAKMAGQYGGSLVKVFLDVLVILLVAGSILIYYWRDEHRSV